MKIELLTPHTEAMYEEYLVNQEHSMVYYSIKYRDFLINQTGCIPFYYMALDNEQIVGILPLMQKEGSLGKVLNSLPYYGSHGGIFSTNEKAKNLLLDHYKTFVQDTKVAVSTLIENPLLENNIYENLVYDEEDHRVGQLTPISKNYTDLEDLMTIFHYKTRNMIRKATKSGVDISIENDRFDFLEATHAKNMDSIGGLAKSSVFFQLIQKVFEPNKDYKLYVARQDGQPIAALLNLYYNNIAEYYTPVVLKDFRHIQPLSLIIAQAMLDASQQGIKWWNWGGTWATQEGVYKFKSRWGTKDFNYKYYITINNREIYKASREKLLTEYSGFYVVPFNKLEK